MKILYIFLLTIFYIGNGFILNFKFGKPFKTTDLRINIDISDKIRTKINNVNGFYGLIGPDVNMFNATSLFQLFMGDGAIQGVFFNNGNLTYVKHHIQTEKLEYEKRNGRIPKDPFTYALFIILSKLRLVPNHLGLANTAMMNVNNTTYALYERDLPYELQIDYHKKKIRTLNRKYIPNVQSFSGHTKYNNGFIETIDYDVSRQCVDYYIFHTNLTEKYKKTIRTNYMPIVHDFITNDRYVILTDAPIIMDLTQVIKTSLPVKFDKNKPCYFHVLNKTSDTIESYIYDKGVYMFHHSHTQEDDTNIYLYTCVYDNFSYLSLNIKGSYRCFVLNKKTKIVSIITNENTEKYNLDFPTMYKNMTILRNLVHDGDISRINGFVMCEGLSIVKTYLYEDVNFCGGDPNIIDIKGSPYICSFGYSSDRKKHYLCLIPLYGEEPIFIDMPVKTNIGFHSIFMHSNI